MLADFHNHSCLSPCATLEMSPKRLAYTAATAGIKIMALTDHNSARNTPAFCSACRDAGVVPLSGLEITTAEECHVLALFDSHEKAMGMSDWVWESLPPIPLDPVRFGDQPVVDENENIVEMIDILLTAATSHTIQAIETETHRRGGLFIPAHINRMAFSVESQLGFLPPGNYDAIEVLAPQAEEYRKRFPNIPVITSSDAHAPHQIGKHPFKINLPRNPSFADIRKQLAALTD